MAKSKKRPPPGEVGPGGDTHAYAQLTIKLAWGDLYRLDGRAAALNTTRTALVRQAVREYLYANEPDRTAGATVFLAPIVAREFEVPVSIARMWMYQGRVLVGGEVYREATINVPPGGLQIEVLEKVRPRA